MRTGGAVRSCTDSRAMVLLQDSMLHPLIIDEVSHMKDYMMPCRRLRSPDKRTGGNPGCAGEGDAGP